MVRFVFPLLLVLAAVGCHAAKSPELRVLGLQDVQARDVVYVQVTNPQSRPMRLAKLEYRFASSNNATVSSGELELFSREVAAGAAVVVEVPYQNTTDAPMTLRGKLTAEQDNITKSFKVSAQIHP